MEILEPIPAILAASSFPTVGPLFFLDDRGEPTKSSITSSYQGLYTQGSMKL